SGARGVVRVGGAEVSSAGTAGGTWTGSAASRVAGGEALTAAWVAAVGAAGLQVERMDLKPLALARGMGVSDGLLLEWGAAEATLVLMVAGRPRFFRSFLLDAPADDVDGQLDELALSLNALVKFMRGTASDVPITPATPLFLGGRFGFLPDGVQRAEQRFDFKVASPPPRFRFTSGFPWQAHFAGLGMVQQKHWQNRLSPSQ